MTDERRQITPKSDSIESAVAALERLLDDREAPTGLAPRLRDLRDALARHCIAMEELGGAFDEILTDSPRLGHHIAELKIEHAAARQAVDDVLASFERAPSISHPAMLASLTARIRPIIERIDRHHRHAADVLHEAYVAEIGAID